MMVRKVITETPMGVHQIDRIAYGCGCQAISSRPRLNTWYICPYHEEPVEQVFYCRRTLWGYIEGSYIPVKHSSACMDELLFHEKAQRKFEREHPRLCRTCWGWGGSAFYESDTGVHGIDPCHVCEENGKCRLCGQHTISDELGDPLDFCQNEHCAVATTSGYCSDEVQGMAPSPECCCEDDLDRDHVEDLPF